MKKKTFENLVQLSFDDKRFLRAMRIITESASYPLEIRASTYSVALETMKSIIIEQNEKIIKPIKNRKKANEIISKLKKIILDVEESELNNRDSILRRLDQINQIGNKEGLLLVFKLLEIELSAEDIKCISKRNDFLHGKMPYQGEDDFDGEMPLGEDNLQSVVYKLHLLISALILKYAGYRGLIINNMSFIKMQRFQMKSNESLFRKI